MGLHIVDIVHVSKFHNVSVSLPFVGGRAKHHHAAEIKREPDDLKTWKTVRLLTRDGEE